MCSDILAHRSNQKLFGVNDLNTCYAEQISLFQLMECYLARIRKIEIKNFRAIRELTWIPSPGINCLIGPGDIGKTTILEAIDLCLGARRSIAVNDTDFHLIDIGSPISITLTLGDLEDCFKNIENYGLYMQSFDPSSGEVIEEPRKGSETVINLNLTIGDDLEPEWALISERSIAQGVSRNIAWKDRALIAPMRLGNYENSNFSWSKGSVLNKISDQKIEAGDLLAQVARGARDSFGVYTEGQLSTSLNIVLRAAKELGVEIGGSAKAMLDVRSVSFSNGAISLHSEQGVPLRNLGTGSSRLLIAGLNQKSANASQMVLIDEVEHGLEPHRLTRLLNAIGAKNKDPGSQVFLTTHSPVALRELRGDQLYVVRRNQEKHLLTPVGLSDEMQGAIRSNPESFLASTVIVCEGASEVGFIRGMDECRSSNGELSLSARGVAYVDAKGGSPEDCLRKGMVYQDLGYKVIAFLDADISISDEALEAFTNTGGVLVTWSNGRCIEDELFTSLPVGAIDRLISYAIEFLDRNTIDNHIRYISKNEISLSDVEKYRVDNGFYSDELRALLAKAANKRGNQGWFKSISSMETIASNVVFPFMSEAHPDLVDVTNKLFTEAHG